MAQQLGVVTGGSFTEGLTVRLDAMRSTEALQVGNFVVIEGEDNRYFSTIAAFGGCASCTMLMPYRAL